MFLWFVNNWYILLIYLFIYWYIFLTNKVIRNNIINYKVTVSVCYAITAKPHRFQ